MIVRVMRTLRNRARWSLQELKSRFERAPDGLPVPPRELRSLVSGDPRDTVSSFLHMGSLCASRIVETLRKNGTDIHSLHAILDFGCGCGRTIRHFRSLRHPKLYGTDYNQMLIDWCKRNLAFVRFDVNQLQPPLIYPDENFELIYAFSVFTHLPPALQKRWIQELSRTLKPNGYLVISTLGEWALGKRPDLRDLLKAGELVSVNDRVAGTNACSAYHTLRSVQDHLASGLEIVEFIPQGVGQDFYLLRKLSDRT